MPNPPHAVTQMPPELLETIVAQCATRTGVFSEKFHHIWTAHYNEVLLYRHFGEMLGIFAKHGFVTTLLSNGTLFDDDRVTIVAENVRKCTICGICLNIPAGEYDAYRRYTGQGPETFARMRDGVAKLLAALPDDFLNRKACSIMVNGVDDKTVDQRSYVGSAAPYMPAMDMYNQVEALKRLFPRANVYPAGGKLDRAGLSPASAPSNKPLWPKMNQTVTGCRISQAEGGRPFGWLHVNPLGQATVCCCDYEFSYVFADLTKQSIEEAWLSDVHVDTIHRAFSTICRTCASAERVS